MPLSVSRRRYRWSITWVDACGCCTYVFRYRTRHEARWHQRSLKMPVRDLRGRDTTLRRQVGPVRG